MSFGSMSSANNSLKNNRALRSSKNDGFKSNNRDVSKGSGKKTMLKFKEVSEEELEKIKLKIRKKASRDRVQLISIAVALTVIVLFGMYKLVF